MSTLEQRFKKWDAENPSFYVSFKHFSNEARNAGKKKISAWLIVNRIRWETTIHTTGDKRKCPNDFIALFSRKFMDENPSFGEFFETRTMTRV